MRQKINKILARATADPEPVVLSFDNQRASSSPLPSERQPPLTAASAAPAAAPDIELMRLQAQRLLAEAQKRLERVQQEVEVKVQAIREEKMRQLGAELAHLKKRALDEAREEGFAEGHRDGFAQAVASVNQQAGDLIDRLRNVVDTATQMKVQELEKIEGEIVAFALGVAAKIIHGEVRLNPDTALSIARACLGKIAERTGITLKVNKDDLDYILSKKEEFSVLEDIENLHVREDPRVGKGGVIMETLSGEVDGRIDVQIDKLRETFENMAGEDR